MLLFLSLQSQFLTEVPQLGKSLLKLQCQGIAQNAEKEKGPGAPEDLSFLIFKGCFQPKYCTKQPRIQQTTLICESKGYLELGNLFV